MGQFAPEIPESKRKQCFECYRLYMDRPVSITGATSSSASVLLQLQCRRSLFGYCYQRTEQVVPELIQRRQLYIIRRILQTGLHPQPLIPAKAQRHYNCEFHKHGSGTYTVTYNLSGA